LRSWTLPAIESHLREILAGPLPGVEAHRRLAPVPRASWPPGGLDKARDAAALLLLYPLASGEVVIPLTVRSDRLARHGGQVSLPGGVLDPGETIEQAALREADEEIGLDPGGARLVGRLTPIGIAVSGFRLHPVVGVTDERPELRPAHGEVAQVLEVPLSLLGDPAVVRRAEGLREGVAIEYPYFDLYSHQVWGATAMILSELLALVDAAPGATGGTP
jgi:8-oxo-dGTP pyrophosphatase MutT (NUDIX family)